MRASELAAEIRARRPPEGVATRIVAVDGPGGAGKSTLADALSAELGGCPVVRTDDFASWDDPVDWWPALLKRVLEPLARGEPARYVPTAWGGPPRREVAVAAGGTVIVEGVTASRAAFRPFVAYAIWVETPREERLRRGLERDGEADARPVEGVDGRRGRVRGARVAAAPRRPRRRRQLSSGEVAATVPKA